MSGGELFTIAGEGFSLVWSSRTRSPSAVEAAWHPRPGRLTVSSLRAGVSAATVDRCVPENAHVGDAAASAAAMGPRLDEQTDYHVYLRPRNGSGVTLTHDDPVVTSGLRRESDGTVHGAVNFRSNVGRSDFHVVVDGRPTYGFTVEVFPTKLDYESDYEAIIAEVQDIATSLALEHLRSTYRLGRTEAGGAVDDLQWVIILEHVFDDLARGLAHVARRPRRAVVREDELVPVQDLRRVDSRVRRSVQRGRGAGPLVEVGGGISARSKVWARPARQTLDTPEHRWLAHQVRNIQRRLARLVRTLTPTSGEPSIRLETQLARLRALEAAAAQLGRLEPLAEATSHPPPGFASQQLTGAPGYREAYQASLILNAGLNLEGNAVRMSTKELHELYEYWCFLIVVRLLSRVLETEADCTDLFRLRPSGLRVALRQGSESAVSFSGADFQVDVRYNPSFASGINVLVPQRPDILITVKREGWPRLHLVLDAKYRLDNSPDYIKRYGAAGPPEDALNVLHRYRDAILESHHSVPSRHVVEAAALFPNRDDETSSHRRSRQWHALRQIGIGSLAALPESTDYVETWLRKALGRSGWEMAERSIPHAAHQHLAELRKKEGAACWLMIVDALTRDRIIASRRLSLPRLEWPIPPFAHLLLGVELEGRCQLTRLPIFSVAMESNEYKPIPDLELVAHLGDPSEEGELPIDIDLELVEGATSLLAVERATALSELLLARVEDWRIRDEATDRGQYAGVDVTSRDLPRRPWIRLAAQSRVRYEGATGYRLRNAGRDDETAAALEDLLRSPD